MSRRAKKIVTIALVLPLIALAIGAAIGLYKHFMKPDPRTPSEAIAISGGESMQVRIKTPLVMQYDPRWATDTIGTTDETLKDEGCTICATAMALTARGFPVTPAELNTKLTANRGFTDSGLLIWKAVRKVAGRNYVVIVDDHPTHAKLDAQLAKGNPIIAKILYENRIWHWVLITGKDGTDYLMHDPLGKGVLHEPMTRHSSGIFTIRYLK